jgi:hypothetical protein
VVEDGDPAQAGVRDESTGADATSLASEAETSEATSEESTDDATSQAGVASSEGSQQEPVDGATAVLSDAAVPGLDAESPVLDQDAGGQAPTDAAASVDPPIDGAASEEDAQPESDDEEVPARDASAAQCRVDRTNTVPGGMPVETDVFCDVVFVCVSVEQEAQVAELAPDFECGAAGGEYGCAQRVCELRPAADNRRLVESEVEQICNLTGLDLQPGAIECRVYL